jgi:hypothetical protein
VYEVEIGEDNTLARIVLQTADQALKSTFTVNVPYKLIDYGDYDIYDNYSSDGNYLSDDYDWNIGAEWEQYYPS